MSRTRSLSRLLALALLVAVFAGASSVPLGMAQSGSGGLDSSTALAASVPTQVFPSSTVPIKRIIYIWTSVNGATRYQIQVQQGSNTMLYKVYPSSVCAGGTCSIRHDIDLSNATYKWRVRAWVGGVWKNYTLWQEFIVSVPVPMAGFYSPFTDNADGWVIHKGTWSLEGSNYFTTVGVASKAATVSHTSNYSTLTYEVRMKRDGCVSCANVIAIRGNPTLDGYTDWWVTEYTFDYTNNGLFSVWRDYYGTDTALKGWTSTSAIIQGGWNVLTVTADGSTMRFYINGTLVWQGSDSAYPSGRVGIGMYRKSDSTGDKLWVDYAQLDTFVASASGPEPTVLAGEEVPGGDRNESP